MKINIEILGNVAADSIVELATLLKTFFINGIAPETMEADAASIEISKMAIRTNQLFLFFMFNTPKKRISTHLKYLSNILILKNYTN